MMHHGFLESIRQIVRDDPRYDIDAYLFLREALDHAVRIFNKPSEGPARHVSGRELLEGIRQYSLAEYGPMTRRVLESWGIRTTEDFGEMVFNMVERGVLGKTDEDKKEDFRGVYDFQTVFEKPYLPREARTSPNARRGKRRAADSSTGTA